MKAIVFWLFYPLLWLISILPFKGLYLLSDFCYVIIYKLIGYRKKVVRYNLKTTFPEKSEKELRDIEREFYSHLCDMFLEMIKSMNIKKEELLKRYQFTNKELITAYDQQGKSTILMMGHYASYEWLFALQLSMVHPGYGIYKKIKHKQFDSLVKNIRGKYNTYLIDAKNTMRFIKNNERENNTGCYAFLSDQSPRYHRAHYWTQFLGHKLPFFNGVERLAKEFKLPVLYFGTEKIKRGHYRGTFQLITVDGSQTKGDEIMTSYAAALEAQIRKNPAYYLWTHKRFKLLGKKDEVLAQIQQD